MKRTILIALLLLLFVGVGIGAALTLNSDFSMGKLFTASQQEDVLDVSGKTDGETARKTTGEIPADSESALASPTEESLSANSGPRSSMASEDSPESSLSSESVSETPSISPTASGTSKTPAKSAAEGTQSPKRRRFQTVGELPGAADSALPSLDAELSSLGLDETTAPAVPGTAGAGKTGSGSAAARPGTSSASNPYALPGSSKAGNADLTSPAGNAGSAGNFSSDLFDISAMPTDTRNASSTSSVMVNSVARSVENGLIIPIYDVDVPAEEAGVMRKLYVEDFQQIQKGEVLIQIDDRQAVMAVNVATAKKEAAEIQKDNQVNVQYAMAAHAVADAEIKQADEANRKVPNTVPVVEYNRLVLSKTQAKLQIEQAQQELKVAAQNYNVSMAELDAAKLDQTKFEIHSPHDGVVMELYRKEGEWLKPGDPILHLVQMNPIRYSFRIESKTPPESIFNREVTLFIPTLNKEFKGKITFIKPSHDIGDMYQVWVDIENIWQPFATQDASQKQKGYWVLQPGMRAEVKKIGK